MGRRAAHNSGTAWATALLLTATLLQSCDTLAEPIESVDGSILRSAFINATLGPEQVPSIGHCVTARSEGSNSSFNGSPPDEIWSRVSIEHSRADVLVGSGTKELAHRIYSATFFAENQTDSFEVETVKGQRLRFGFWIDSACDSPPPTGLLTDPL